MIGKYTSQEGIKVVRGGVIATHGDHGGQVRLLGQQPASGPERRDYSSSHLLRIGKMDQQIAALNKVVRLAFQGIGPDVVPPHFQVGQLDILKEARVNVGGHDLPERSDPRRQPAGD
jgi:hypothetical protein